MEEAEPEYDDWIEEDYYSDENVKRGQAEFRKMLADNVEEIIDKYWNDYNLKEIAYRDTNPSAEGCEYILKCIIWTNYFFRSIDYAGSSNYGEEFDLWKYIKQQIHKRRCDYILKKFQAIREVGNWFGKDTTSIIKEYL